MSRNSSDNKNDFNYQQELSKFLHTGCSKPIDCRIMTVKKPNLILEARYCGELVGEICNIFLSLYYVFSTFTAYDLTPLYTTWVYLTQSACWGLRRKENIIKENIINHVNKRYIINCRGLKSHYQDVKISMCVTHTCVICKILYIKFSRLILINSWLIFP